MYQYFVACCAAGALIVALGCQSSEMTVNIDDPNTVVLSVPKMT